MFASLSAFNRSGAFTDESRASWSPEEVHALLTLWADGSVQEQLLSTVRNKRVFTKLSSELAALGSTKTSKQCREKIKKLKQEYKKIKNDTSKNSSNSHGTRWFAIMDAVLSQRTRTSMLLESTQLKSLPEAEDSGKLSCTIHSQNVNLAPMLFV